MIRFDEDGSFLADETDLALADALAAREHAVVPGFYGATAAGLVRTFSRGGSDVTGALVARAARADVYENWTDVSGILMADPRVVDSPRPIPQMSYAALRQLTCLGASVLHENAIHPVREVGIPINIRNTGRPEDEGTWIQQGFMPPQDAGDTHALTDRAIIGLAGRVGYTALTIRKAQWSGSLGVGTAILRACDETRTPVDLVVTGVDSWTLLILADVATVASVVAKLETLEPEAIEVRTGLAVVGIVSASASPGAGLNACVAEALARAEIEVLAEIAESNMHTVIVDAGQYDSTLRTLYDALA